MNNNIQVIIKSSTTQMSLNDHDSGIYIVPELNGLTGLPDIRTTSGVNAGYDGGWTTAQNYDARSIVIRGVIANEDEATVERMRRELVTLLGQGKREELTLDIVTDTGSSYELQVRTIACDMAMQRVLTQQEFMITLRADDPLIYDNTEGGESVTIQVQKALGGFQIDFELPLAIGGSEDAGSLENNGMEEVYPVVKMYGSLHNPAIINQTTNQEMQIETTLGYAAGTPINPETTSIANPLTITDTVEAPLNDYSLYGNTEQQLPDGYTAVEYIENSTDRYIDTGYVPNSKTRFRVVSQMDGSSGWDGCVIGMRQSGQQDFIVWDNNNDTQTTEVVQPRIGGENGTAKLFTNSDFAIRTIEYKGTEFFVDGTKTSDITGTQSDTTTGKLLIFKLSSTDSRYWRGKFYGLTIYEDGAIVKNFVPAIRNSDNKAGLIETLTNQFLLASDNNTFASGGTAPSPNTPIHIKTTTGENVVKICGKNLFDVQDATGTRDNNTVVASSQTITLNSNTSGTETAFYLNDVSQIGRYLATSASSARDYKITGFGGSYTLTITLANIPSGAGALLWAIYTNKRAIQYVRSDIVDGKIIKTITLSDDEYIKSVQFYTSSTNVFSDFTMTVQIELGSATAYEPYKDQSYTVDLDSIELCKIGTYQDYIYKSGEKWYVHKEVGKVVLNGSENDWTRGPLDGDATYRFFVTISGIKTTQSQDSLGLVLSDKLIEITNVSQYSGTEGIRVRSNGSEQLSISTYATQTMTVDNFKAWLATNNIIAYYALATPTDTEITNQALVAQLDAILANAKTYAGTTNISLVATAGNASGELKVTYYTAVSEGFRDEVIIDSRLKTITFNGTDIYNLKTSSSVFPMLAPGKNKILLRSDNTGDNGYAEVSYKQGYLSI